MSEYGDRGTNAIITADDVSLAYRIALSVAEATYLRTSEYGDIQDHDTVDAAEMLAFRNGYVEVDIGAVFAQTLGGIADDLVLGWLDYFMFTKVLDIIEAVADALWNAVNWLFKAVTKNEIETAQGYLKATMSNHGIPESEYRYLLGGTSASIPLPAAERILDDIGENVITVPAATITVPYPNVDVLNWNGWNGFMSKYRAEHSIIRESLRGTINSIIIGTADTYNLGAVRVRCDPYDTKDFMTTLIDAVTTALNAQRGTVEDLMESTIRSGKIVDSLYVTIYEQMAENKDSLFGVNEFRNNIRNAIRSQRDGKHKGRARNTFGPGGRRFDRRGIDVIRRSCEEHRSLRRRGK
jgi:hypothetical protein